MSNFQAWASVKVENQESEFFGRAGTVMREERDAVVVKLDATPEEAEVVKAFAVGELRGL